MDADGQARARLAATPQVETLKADQTLLYSDGSRILVTNYNYPLQVVRDADDLEAALARNYASVVRDYEDAAPNSLQYYVTCTYRLVHTQTNEVRFWAGSFNPRTQHVAKILDFTAFGPSFVPKVRQAFDVESARTRLSAISRSLDTSWAFDDLASFIVSVQGRVTETNVASRDRRLETPRTARGRRTRRHVVFVF